MSELPFYIGLLLLVSDILYNSNPLVFSAASNLETSIQSHGNETFGPNEYSSRLHIDRLQYPIGPLGQIIGFGTVHLSQ